MNLIYSNDKRGKYPESWYAATATPLDPFPDLKGEVTADVCVVGGGYTGLSTALHLAEEGYSVVLLEAQRVGFGASGRNGGQVGSGHNMEQEWLEKKLGKEDARNLWDIADASIDITRKLVAKHAPEANYRPGHVEAYYTAKEAEYAARKRDYLIKHYDHDRTELLSSADMEALIGNPAYAGGILDKTAGHLHPLRYAIGLARAAVAASAQIYEGAYVHSIREGAKTTVQTERGRVIAEHVVLACNGYSNNLARKTAARVMPINNYMVATEPLGDRAKQVLSRDVCVYDSKFVLNYYRMSEDGRLLFGGGESYGVKFPANIEAKVRKPLETLYPQLKGTSKNPPKSGLTG
ncbi:NAD(P)/FAD-dependent oxidoreductase [Profundibacter sp.]|uniref:NAD(P)/FAD-dependent oxidoreductase n=1 Tax=Profundibacter sp. TaxID=3101071 RepID=UPI003D14B85F